MGGVVAGLAMSQGIASAVASIYGTPGTADPQAHGKGPAPKKKAHSPCAGKGLAAPANEKQFAQDMKTLQKDCRN